MQSLKSMGGLTHGRGMNESERALWILSMPACSAYDDALRTFTDTSVKESSHGDLSESRKNRDNKDCDTLIAFFTSRNPFTADCSLRNISNGVCAEDTVNVNKTKEIGERYLKHYMQAMLDENNVKKAYTFKKNLQAINFAVKSKVKIAKGVFIDSNVLFQRLLVSSESGGCKTSEALCYELTNCPPSLFEAPHLMREATQKATLCDGILKQCSKDAHVLPNALPEGPIQFVLDGGSLLQRIPWEKQARFGKIVQSYVNYVDRFHHPTVVFDGYPDFPTTKDQTQSRRTQGTCTDVSIELEKVLSTPK